MWRLPPNIGPVVSVWVTFQLTVEPSTEDLYFWALQASFTDEAKHDFGAAHTGLQWNFRHPHGRAANWGGYPAEHSNWKKNFAGSANTLPGFKDDPNTRHFRWTTGTPYRLTISAAPEQGWRASVIDLDTMEHTVLRDLFAEGDRLEDICVWTEWFCSCDAPTVEATWTEFRVLTVDGQTHVPDAMFLNHPSDGNCTNVGHRVIHTEPELEIAQIMNTTRELPHGTVLPVRPSHLHTGGAQAF
jgi:hypothetical protein